MVLLAHDYGPAPGGAGRAARTAPAWNGYGAAAARSRVGMACKQRGADALV